MPSPVGARTGRGGCWRKWTGPADRQRRQECFRKFSCRLSSMPADPARTRSARARPRSVDARGSPPASTERRCAARRRPSGTTWRRERRRSGSSGRGWPCWPVGLPTNFLHAHGMGRVDALSRRCPRRDLNPHTLRLRILSPSPHVGESICGLPTTVAGRVGSRREGGEVSKKRDHALEDARRQAQAVQEAIRKLRGAW